MNRLIFFATLLYWLFVIYGSLVPLDFNAIALDTAVSRFKAIPYLDLGAGARADWIANILLYIPLAYGASILLGIGKTISRRLLQAILVLIFCMATAVAIEFAQLFFPPRTVSLNDLLAETLGTVVGIGIWQFRGEYFNRLYRQLRWGNVWSARAAAIFYLLAYLTLCFFPFDFVTSWDELNAKLASDEDMAFLPIDSCMAEPLRCGVKLQAEILAVLPLGWWLYQLPYIRFPILSATLLGFFLGVGIETVQLFLLSGHAQGSSILSRALGMGIGAALCQRFKKQDKSVWKRLLPRLATFAILPYILLVLGINGWFSGAWSSPEQALVKLEDTHYLPLYYFYFTTESVAFTSLISNVGLYFPIGIMYWAGNFTTPRQHKPHWVYCGLLAASFALCVEAGKLFLLDKHADPSDVWLAFIAAAGTYALLNALPDSFAHHAMPSQPSAPPSYRPGPELKPVGKPLPLATELPEAESNGLWRLVSVLLWMFIVFKLFDYPGGALALALGGGLALYSLIQIRSPFIWLIVVPALLPIMDFAPWTGRFFFDESDLLVLATLACYFWQKNQLPTRSLLGLPSLLIVVIFGALYGLSLLKGLLPLTEMDANAFNNYYSHYNSLREGKGFIWALSLLPLLQQTVRRYRYAPQYLGYGILLGLAGVIVAACWERFLFPGLFNFSNEFRITALFSAMHTGGGYIDGYLALTLPFIALLFMPSTHFWLTRLFGFGLFVTGLYVLLVTFSRGPYLAAGLEFIVLIIGLAWCFKGQWAVRWRKFLWVPILAALVPAIAMPVFKGKFIQDRFAAVAEDADIRMAHWHDALAMMDEDMLTSLLGMGIGSYPRTYFWQNHENVTPAMYQIGTEEGNAYLKLSSGDSLYLGQHLPINPHTSYRLEVDLRSDQDKLALTLPICEKSLLYSFNCSWNTVEETAPARQWRHFERTIDSQDVGETLGRTVGRLSKRPVQLSLFNGRENTVIEVDNVSLTDATGKNLLVNGDFSQGTDYWFFATDNHLPWHIKNLLVQVLFEQGGLGVAAFLLLFVYAIYRCCQKLGRGNAMAAILLSAFSGFVVIGCVDSTFDAPRLTLLFFLLLFLALLRTPNAWQQTAQRMADA